MLPLLMPAGEPGRPVSVLVVGAHPDDIEIGAGGLLLALGPSRPRVRYVLFTGSEDRRAEAKAAASAFLPEAELTMTLHDLPEGRLPALWGTVKDLLEAEARSFAPDVVIAPNSDDAHQDHRTIAEIIRTVFRDALYLGYEIPKWDGDLGRPTMYVPMTDETARRKVELLNNSYPSQRGRDWWSDDVFLGLARLRGMECRAPYAEAFHCGKAIILPAAPPVGAVGR
jgi:LmbE family N-acetylglucosaminyl deacetylase